MQPPLFHRSLPTLPPSACPTPVNQSRHLLSPGRTQIKVRQLFSAACSLFSDNHGPACPRQHPACIWFLSLPDIAHANIATFLPDGNKTHNDTRLRVSEASRALLEYYGGSLTRVAIRCVGGSNIARLGALLQRQQKRYALVVKEPAIPMLCQVIAQGCCHRVGRIYLDCDLTEGGLHILLGALKVDGAMPMLESLTASSPLTPEKVVEVTQSLTRGVVPHLKKIVFYGYSDALTLESFSLALQIRATIPGCRGLEHCKVGSVWNWLDNASLETKTRFLRALLPSVKELPPLFWNQAFDPCFLEAPAPYLTSLDIRVEEDGAVFSSGVLEAAPALLQINIGTRNYQTLLNAPVL